MASVATEPRLLRFLLLLLAAPREAPPLPAVLKGWGMGLGLQRGGAESRLVVDLRGWGPRRRSSQGASVGLIGSGRGMGKGCPGNGLQHREGGGTAAEGFSGTFDTPTLAGLDSSTNAGAQQGGAAHPLAAGKGTSLRLSGSAYGSPA